MSKWILWNIQLWFLLQVYWITLCLIWCFLVLFHRLVAVYMYMEHSKRGCLIIRALDSGPSAVRVQPQVYNWTSAGEDEDQSLLVSVNYWSKLIECDRLCSNGLVYHPGRRCHSSSHLVLQKRQWSTESYEPVDLSRLYLHTIYGKKTYPYFDI